MIIQSFLFTKNINLIGNEISYSGIPDESQCHSKYPCK